MLSDIQVSGYVALFSVLVLGVQCIVHRSRVYGYKEEDLQVDDEGTGSDGDDALKSASPSRTKSIYRLLQLFGCCLLLSVTIATVAFTTKQCEGISGSERRVHSNIVLSLTLAYNALLIYASIRARPRWSAVFARHGNGILLVMFLVYGYRDLLPMASLNKVPLDYCEGRLLWAKVALLFFTAVVIPLAIPREYIPVDRRNPMPEPNPEQTASLFSLIFFFFLDPIVFSAYRVAHFPYQDLPPLADTDQVKNLKAAKFRYLDPFLGGKTRHIFYGILQAFRFEWIQLVSLSILFAILDIVSPIAVNRLLNFIETDGVDAEIRPWFWICLLLFNPIFESMAVEWYLRTALTAFVQIEALITQLVYEHALRIRVEADTSDTSVSKAPSSQKLNLAGRLNNLVTADVSNIMDAKNCIVLIGELPLEFTLNIIFLYAVLGWSAFVGVAVTFLLAPIPTKVANLGRKLQAERMKRSDERVHVLTDVINVLRMVKLFGWEQKMESKISDSREKELAMLKKGQYVALAGEIVNNIRYITLILRQDLNASKVFSSLVVFETLQRHTRVTFLYINRALKAKVSLDRLDDFLHNTKLLDTFTSVTSGSESVAESSADFPTEEIGFRNAMFSWTDETGDAISASRRRRFLLKVDDTLLFKRNQLNLVIGPTGSGKTSLLLALLGEMQFIPLGPEAGFRLPRENGIAYAAQESWVQNETIKNNILFTTEFDEARYKKVIHQCGLERDLALFEAGDATEVGEKGLTLSGGQKARLTLARAVYSHADILLLDDILAALDVHTAKWIVEKCLLGDLVHGRTVILVTHNVELVQPFASFTVSMKDGKVADCYSSVPRHPNTELIRRLPPDVAHDEESSGDGAHESKNGTLVVAEEIEEGHINSSAVNLYASALGGNHTILFFAAFLCGLFLTSATSIFQTWFLGYWASKYEGLGEVRVALYLSVYVAILFLVVLLNAVTSGMFISGVIRSSRSIHGKLVETILGTTFRWLDKTPTSRIITRFTQDINAVDTVVPEMAKAVVGSTMKLLLKLATIVIFTPLFLVPGVMAVALGALCARIYLRAQMSVKREMSVAKAPVLGHFAASVNGLTSIRAYAAQRAVKQEMLARIDKHSRCARVFYNLQRWMAIRMQILAGVFVGSLAFYLVYVKKDNASNTGFMINTGVTFTSLIFSWIINVNNLEAQSNSIERIHHYLQVEQEPKAKQEGKAPAYWPASGDLTVESLCAKYSPDGPEVLHNLSFHIKSGERVGIVGRTGSGKSSLMLSLLRSIYTTGTVLYDGIPTSSLNLDALRSKVTIIPQIPELISGSLRQNLDPFEEYDDQMLNDALRSAGLFTLQEDMKKEDRISLDTAISGGGSNLSVGQRQIVALARAIVRRSKLFILDEATSAIDYKTDAIIQSYLRTELRDVTVLTIAHRLQTIMDADKIMVLDAGKIVEFGVPEVLLQKPDGVFRALVNESENKKALRETASSLQPTVVIT